jgi:Zn-dependent protease
VLGDDTAARQGRVTLNPLSHLDPIGSIGVLLIAVAGVGIGWGRPVPVNPARVRYRQRGLALTAIAGPVSNLVIAVLFVIPLRFGDLAAMGRTVEVFVTYMVLVNLLLWMAALPIKMVLRWVFNLKYFIFLPEYGASL